jgi:hypothetical protein
MKFEIEKNLSARADYFTHKLGAAGSEKLRTDFESADYTVKRVKDNACFSRCFNIKRHNQSIARGIMVHDFWFNTQ